MALSIAEISIVRAFPPKEERLVVVEVFWLLLFLKGDMISFFICWVWLVVEGRGGVESCECVRLYGSL